MGMKCCLLFFFGGFGLALVSFSAGMGYCVGYSGYFGQQRSSVPTPALTETVPGHAHAESGNAFLSSASPNAVAAGSVARREGVPATVAARSASAPFATRSKLRTAPKSAADGLPGRWYPQSGSAQWVHRPSASVITGTIASAMLLGPARTPFTLGKEYWPAVAGSTFRYQGKQGWQMAIAVDGTASARHRDITLVKTIRVKGAFVQETREVICRLFELDLNKPRNCSDDASGSFHSVTYIYFPALIPMSTPVTFQDYNLDLKSRAMSAEQLEFYKLDRANIHAMFEKGFQSQVFKDQHIMIAKVFVKAVSELPGPFTIIESGNFCGGVTQLLAILKQKYCPLCRFITIDPTLQAHQKNYEGMQCSAMATLKMLGLENLVELHEHFSADMLIPGPIGFAYFDDGKIREAMAPQIALIDRHLMDGGYIGFDDYSQHHPIKGPDGWAKHVPKVIDHRELMSELVSSGDYVVRAAGEVSTNFGCLQRLPRAASEDPPRSADPWAQIDLSLQDRNGISFARAALTIDSPSDVGMSIVA